MKKIILILIIINTTLFAQNGINYQGAATDSDGAKLVDQNISLRTSVLQGGIDGTTSYSEIHNTTTDQFGLFNVVIGQGVSVSGDFETISWGSGDHFLKVELDATGGTNYNLVSTTQMMSVPYALYAKNAGLDSAAVADMLASMNISSNSGGCDLKFPEGLSGIPTTESFSNVNPYTVPSGKHLYILEVHHTNSNSEFIKINEKIMGYDLYSGTHSGNYPLALSENDVLTTSDNDGASFNGILVEQNTQLEIITESFSNVNPFTVPSGKHLYILEVHHSNSDNEFIKINGKSMGYGLYNGGHSSNYPLALSENDVLTTSDNDGASFNGYLVDEDYFADCGGGGGSSSTPSSIDSAMVADMIAANTSSGSGGDWELLYDELNTNNDEPYGTVNRYGIAQSDGFLYLVGSYATVYTGNDHDTITNTWPENPILQNISANDPNEAHIIPLKKNMSWHIEFHSTLGYITKGYFIPNGGGSASLANAGMSGISKSFKYPDGMHGTPITIAVGTDNSYTVPEGKNLYVNYFRPSTGGNLYVDGVRVAISYNNLTTENGSDLLYVGEGQTITCDNNLDINEMSTLNGFLTDKSVDMVSFGIGGDLNNYTVPIGKNLYVNYFRPSSGGSLYIDGIRVATSYNNFTTNKGSDLLYVGEGQTITCDNNLDINEMSTLNGYLADLDYFESSSSSSASNSGGGENIDINLTNSNQIYGILPSEAFFWDANYSSENDISSLVIPEGKQLYIESFDEGGNNNINQIKIYREGIEFELSNIQAFQDANFILNENDSLVVNPIPNLNDPEFFTLFGFMMDNNEQFESAFIKINSENPNFTVPNAKRLVVYHVEANSVIGNTITYSNGISFETNWYYPQSTPFIPSGTTLSPSYDNNNWSYRIYGYFIDN